MAPYAVDIIHIIWTDRIARGELPKQTPPRPQGYERNVVVTSWEWSTGAEL
jgi:hypothetical protein